MSALNFPLPGAPQNPAVYAGQWDVAASGTGVNPGASVDVQIVINFPISAVYLIMVSHALRLNPHATVVPQMTGSLFIDGSGTLDSFLFSTGVGAASPGFWSTRATYLRVANFAAGNHTFVMRAANTSGAGGPAGLNNGARIAIISAANLFT